MEKNNNNIHEKRCNGDPIYTLLFFPTREDFLDKLVLCAVQVLEKRYGQRLMRIPVIKRVLQLLQNIDFHEGQFVALVCIIHKETSLTHAVANMYTNAPETLFGEESRAHYYRFMATMGEYVDKTLKFPYNKTNSMETIRNSMEERSANKVLAKRGQKCKSQHL